MSNMCLVVTPAIEELASKIQQEYPEACQRNGFNNQMCAEWIGLYNNTNSKNPDSVPAMKSLVNFIERLRNQEGKSFLRDLEEEKEQYAIEQEIQEIKAKAQADGTFMKAPNGKDTNLTERQWLQVRTKAFKNWFGDWERIAKNKYGISIGKTDIAEIINGDGSINFAKLEEITDKYFNTADESLFKKGRKTLRTRKEHHVGESNTLEHLQNVVRSATEIDIREDLKPQLILAAALHDLAKPFHGGQLHGFQSVDVINKVFKGNISDLVKFAVRNHMLTLEEGVEFSQKDANRIMQDAYDNGLNLDAAIEMLLAINTADIMMGMKPEDLDYYSGKTKKETIESEIPAKRVLLKNAVKNIDNSASKVVDENGEPLVVYHGTPNKFTIFERNRNPEDEGVYGKGLYFSNWKTYASDYGDILMPVFLNIRNPKEMMDDDFSNYGKEILGNDGVIANLDRWDVGAREYAVPNPNQIKSATDNSGMFSTENDSILASPAQYEEIPVELMVEMIDEEASITAYDFRESSDPDLNKKFGDKTDVSVSEMLNNLLANNTPFEGFVKALQENIGELGDIRIKLVPNSRPEIRGNAGGYSSLDNTIYINRNANYKGKDGKVDNTIIHEIIHAIVANSLNTPKHREELGKLFDEAKEKILKKYGVENFDELPEYLRKGRLYGLQNLDEFAAEFFTNSEFISELNDENTFGKRSSKKSLFNRLVEWIKSLLPKGVTETYKRSGEILEDILLNSGGTIQASRNLLAGGNNAANTQAQDIESKFKSLKEELSPALKKEEGRKGWHRVYKSDDLYNGAPVIHINVYNSASDVDSDQYYRINKEGKIESAAKWASQSEDSLKWKVADSIKYPAIKNFFDSIKNNTTNTQQHTSTIEPRFKQGIETLAGYYEGGGASIADDLPGLPKRLDDKLNNHFMRGEELSDDDYRELAKYISVVKNTDANTSQSWPYIAVPKQQTSQQQSKFNVSQAEFYSGAAMGSDTAWAKEARKLGIKVVDYTVGNYEALSPSEKAKYDAEYKEVARTIGKNESPEGTYTGKLLRRDMMQADSADAIFAIGTLNSRGFVEGGTGYATTRGIIRGIPVFVYDRRNKQWKIWSDSSRKFITTSIPTLTPHAAVIGTRGDIIDKDDRGRDIYDIKEEEKQVIRDVLTKTVGQQPSQQPPSISSPSQAASINTSQQLVPKARGQMTFDYGTNKRPEVKAVSTLEAIKNGERRATTRYESDGHIDYWKNLNVGDIVEFTGKNGEKVLVRITKPLTKLPSNTNAEEWSKKEGWSVEYFNSKVKPKLGQAWQMEYEYIPQNSSPSSPSQNTVRPSNRVVVLGNDEVQEVSEPKPLPQSDSFKTALKVTDNPIAKFYQTFTPQQIKDRGSMIASYFSDILDDYILDELDRLEEEIKKYDDVIKNNSSNRYQKREAQRSKEEATTLKNLLRDPVNGRQYASQKIEDAKTGTKGIKAIIEQVKRKIRDAADRHDGVEKQLWQNTYDYFDDLFNNQASLEIEEQEGIRIVGLQTVETTPDEVATEEENDGNDETGHTVSGNDGWLFQVRFEDPASSLSKRVRRMLYNIKRSDADKDDLGQDRKYSSGQIYATLLSYLAKNMQNPDDFMYVVHSYDELPEELSSPIRIQDEEEFGDRYPNGYPVFPVLEKMGSQYPWVRQIITRLADDYLDKDWNTCIAYPSTYGAMASQFYTNFRKVFIPYAKIQTGTQRDGSDYFGITPLNTEMEARCQKDKLAANFNNGIVMTDTCIYNQDTTINREHADDLKDYILDVTNDGGVEHAYSLYSDLSDSTSETTEAVTKEFNDFTDRVVFLLNSFGISSNRDNVIALLAQEEQGKVLLDMLKDLHYIADLVSKLSDEKAKDFNYFLDLRYTGGEPVWGKFFDGRGMITDESYMQSFYDSASKKTRYSYSADNYLQKTFRGLYNPNLDERKAFIEENFMKYEWFYNHKTNTWRNKWLEHLYTAQDITDTLPYRNINNTSEFKKGETKEVRDYRMWTPDDVWLVQNRSFDSTKPYAFYLAPIFSDSPMSMTVKGPVLSNDEVLDAFVGLVDQEMWRIKYAGEREAAIERGEIKPIANFDVIDGKGGRGKKFCFIPELNDFTFENGEKFTDAITRMRDNKAEDGSTVVYSEEDIANMEKDAIKAIMNQKALEYLRENVGHYNTEHLDTDEFLRGFMNMAYANAAIIQLTTIDLAFYKSDVDFQKRFKEVYAGGIQLNTNSRYGKKTENTILLADDIITSPSYDTIAKIINSNPNLTNKDKEHILSAFTGINVADAQAIRSMHSFRSVMDMMGRWDEKAEEALEHFEKGEWGKEDFDTIFQTIKPFVYTVIDRNDGNGGVIPVPQQHKNSEICALMMYDLITNDLNSPVYKALSKFMETKDSNGEYLIDMIQFESAGKVGNQGLINISFNPDKVMKMLNSEEYDFVAAAPNTLENAETNYKAIKKQVDKKLVGGKITQEEYDKVMQSLRPTEEEIISILEQTALVKDADGNTSINPEVVHTIPFDNYYQAQPTPEHHIDAEATFGSQARNIAVADLPDDFTLTVKVKGSNHTFRGKDAVIDFYYELLDENLIEDFYGDGREGSRNKDGLKGIFSSKESLMEAVTDIVRGNPKYGKDFVDALRTDGDGNFTISPNSPTMFTLMQELVTSLFKNRITKQKINGAALIQAAGIGLDNELRLLKDNKGKIIGAECLMPLTSENFFRPLLKTDEDGRKYFDVNDLPEDLRKAVGYRIPTENKSSMLPLYIKGFTPQQNGSAIILPAEITTLAGSDFDVDKMFVMLSEFYIQNYDMEEARKAWAEEEYLPTSVFSNPSLDDELSEADPEAFREWFKENKDKFRWTGKGERSKIKRVEYNWNLTPKQNGRKARNNMLIQMIYGILTSEAGNQSLLNPQGFDNLKNAAKLNRIIKDPVLSTQLLQTYGDVDDAADAVLGFSLDQKEDFIKEYSSPDAPIYPQTFAHSHAKNMAGSNQIGIYAIQASMAAKYQRADITLKEFQRFTVNGRVIKNVDVSDNGKRLKSCGEMIGASADNGKDPNLSDAGSTSKTAPIIGYMLRLGLTHEEAVLIINQPIMEEFDFNADTMERNYHGNIRMLYPGEVDTKTLVKAILDPESIDYREQQAIDAMCYRILKQAKAMEGLTMISRADSPNGAMQNTFAKARIQQYMVERFNAEMKQSDFPFYPINEVINNTTVDVSKGEENVREALGKQPMAFLHAMYGLGINSLNDLASPYFFMLRDNFDDAIVKPILYNQSSTGRDHLEDLVNNIYMDYITYSLSASPLFGEEDNKNGEHTSMKSKREYYLNTFPDDFAKILQENEEIRRLLGNILKREIIKDKYTGAVTKRIVLDDVGSLAKGQRDIISRRFDALLSSKEGQDLAKHLLLYAYYDTGLNFSHNSYSTRLSTYFLSQFPAFREMLQQLDTPLTEEQQQNFIYQFLITHKDAAFNVDSIKSKKMQVNSGSIVVDLSDNNLHRKFTNTILSPDPRMTGVKPYPFISYDGNVYELDADAYARERNIARYYMLEDYPTSSRRPVYNINLSLSQLADEYLGTEEQQESGETSVDENTSPDIAHNSGNENPAVDNTDTQTSDTSGEIDFDNLFEAPASESENYENEGKSSLESPFC